MKNDNIKKNPSAITLQSDDMVICSTDLSPYDYILWGYQKDLVFKYNQ